MGRTLLIVDDEDFLRETLCEILTRGSDFVCLEAGSGQAALEILQGKPVDLVLTDQTMMDMSGVELIQKIRQQGLTIPTILYSGYHDLQEEALQKGATRVLGKPLPFRELLQEINALLK